MSEERNSTAARLREQLEAAERRIAALEEQLSAPPSEAVAEAAALLADDVVARIFETSATLEGISRMSDGRFIAVNRAALQVLGYTRDEVIGHTSAELGLWDDPKQRDEMTAVVARDGLIRDYAMRIRTKGGELRHGLMSVAKVMVTGEPHLLLSVVDVTRLKHAEQELRSASALFEAIVQQSRDGIALARPDGRYRLVNPALCAMTGYRREQLLQKPYSYRVLAERLERVLG